MIEYTLIIACISLVIAVVGPPVAEAVQGQFTKVANVISNGSTGGTGGGSDFPGGGSGGGGDNNGGDTGGGDGGNQGGSGGDSGDKTDTDGDGIPDSEDAYPNDPNNGTGDRDGDGIMDKDDQYPDDPSNGKPAVSRLTGTVSVSDCTVGLTSTAVCSDAPSGAVLQYKWFIDGAEASTGPTRAFTKDDLNKNVYVAVSDTAGKFEGQVTSPIQRVSAREMSGTATFGSLVAGKPATAHISGAPSGANLKFTWYADGVIVSAEQTFTPAAEHVGKSVYVEVTDKNGVYTGSVASSAKIVAEDESTKPVENKLTGSLSIGDCVVGLTTTAFASDIPADAQLEFTWLIGGVSTGGETHEFTLDEANAEVRVTAVDGSGKYSGKLYSNVVRVKTRSITGTVSFAEAIVDKDLSAILNGVPTDIAAKDLKYSWTLNGAEVGTDASYTPKTDDIGGVLVLEVKDGSGKYAGSLISQSQIVRAKSASEGEGGSGGGSGAIGTQFTGSVAIEHDNANPLVGDTLTASVSTSQSDASLRYQWKRDGEDIGGAVYSTYVVNDKDAGKDVTVEVYDGSNKYQGRIVSESTFAIALWTTGSDEAVANMVAAADAGRIKLSDYWKSGDTRSVLLNAMENDINNGLYDNHIAQTVEYVLSDPGHYTLANGKKCNFVVIQKNSLKEKGYMCYKNASYGWEDSVRRAWCNSTYLNSLPEELKRIFKKFKVVTSYSGPTALISWDYFSFFSEKEVFGKNTYAYSDSESECTQLEYYKLKANRIKVADNRNSSWWLRSPRSSDHDFTCIADSSGEVSYRGYSNENGLAPFGCI